MTSSIPCLDDDQLAHACKALAHPARLQILRRLLEEDRCICGRIVDVMPLAQSTVSQHLKTLKEAGLIRGEVEGQTTCYCADRDMLRLLALAIGDLLATPTPVPLREESLVPAAR